MNLSNYLSSVLVLAFLVSACTDRAVAPDLTPEFLAGRWATTAEDCAAEYGAVAAYSPEGTIVFEDGEEPYEIRGDEIHFFNPFDGEMGHEVVEPLAEDRMRVTQLDGEHYELVRCAKRTTNDPARNANKSTKSAAPISGDKLSDAELYGIYQVRLSCVDVHRRPMPLTGCFAGNREPGRVGYIDANDEFSYTDMQMLRELTQSSETFVLTAPFTFYAQSFGNTPYLLLGQVVEGDEIVEEKIAAAGNTIAFGRDAVRAPVRNNAELVDLIGDDLERKVAEIEALTAE